jgi:catechol 2,3-dioxygenase-like lactoylglutathione lyase family enzyme
MFLLQDPKYINSLRLIAMNDKSRLKQRFGALVIAVSLVPCASFSQQVSTMPFEMAKQGLDVGVVVGDLEKSRKFYGDALGFKTLPELPFELPGGGQMIRFQAGATVIKLRTYPITPPATPTGVYAANGIRLLTLFVQDPEGVAQRLTALGFTPPQYGAEQPGGFRFGFVQDPEGNQLEVVTFANPPPGIYDRFQIGLTVSNVDKAREFYGKTLGLAERPPVQLPPTIAADTMQYSFVAGLSTIKFSSPKTTRPTQTGPINAATGIRYITFIVKDVDSTYQEIKSRGVPVLVEPRNLGTAARIMLITDPDGNVIEFAAALPQSK